jgi:hypothetical protein
MCELFDNPSTRGQIFKVAHLVSVIDPRKVDCWHAVKRTKATGYREQMEAMLLERPERPRSAAGTAANSSLLYDKLDEAGAGAGALWAATREQEASKSSTQKLIREISQQLDLLNNGDSEALLAAVSQLRNLSDMTKDLKSADERQLHHALRQIPGAFYRNMLSRNSPIAEMSARALAVTSLESRTNFTDVDISSQEAPILTKMRSSLAEVLVRSGVSMFWRLDASDPIEQNGVVLVGLVARLTNVVPASIGQKEILLPQSEEVVLSASTMKVDVIADGPYIELIGKPEIAVLPKEEPGTIGRCSFQIQIDEAADVDMHRIFISFWPLSHEVFYLKNAEISQKRPPTTQKDL